MNTKNRNWRLTPIQGKTIFFALTNFTLGFSILAFNQTIQEIIFNGLYHKILFSFPIGALSMALISTLFGILFYMLIVIDYRVFKYGIDSIKIDGK